MDLAALADAAIGLIVAGLRERVDDDEPRPGSAQNARGDLYALVRGRLDGTYFAGILDRLCGQPDDEGLAGTVRAALIDLVQKDRGFATALRQEIERAQHGQGDAGPDVDQTVIECGETSGNHISIGTMRGSQFALGSIVNSRNVRVSLGIGLPLLVVAALVLWAILGGSNDDEAGARDQEEPGSAEVADASRTTRDRQRTTTTTTPAPSPGAVAWSWQPDEALTAFTSATFGDYAVVVDLDADTLIVHDRVTGEELDRRPAPDIAAVEVVPHGDEGWALAVRYETEVPADGLEPARVESRVELYTDPAGSPAYTGEYGEDQESYFTGAAHLVRDIASETGHVTAYSVETGDTLWSSDAVQSIDGVGRSTFEAFSWDTNAYTLVSDTTGEVVAEIAEGETIEPAEPGTDVWEGYGQRDDGSAYYFVMHGGERGPDIADPNVSRRIDAKVEATTGVLAMSLEDSLVGYDGRTGEQVWSVEATFAGGVQDGLIHLRHAGRVVLRANDQIVVVDAATGEQTWTSGAGLPPEDELQLLYDDSDVFYDGGPTVSGNHDGQLLTWYVGEQLPVAQNGGTILLAP